MDIRTSFATQTYAQARPMTEAAPADTVSDGATSDFSALVGSFTDKLQAGENAAKSAMTETADAHSLVEALAASELAVETAVTLRDKVVEAYQEILRMQV